MELPKLDIPKPKSWDLIAAVVLLAGVAVAGWNLTSATGSASEGAISTGLTLLIVTIQLVLCIVGLMALGKTAKEGTIWGNLAAVGAMLIGMSGVLLATALWAAA